MPIVSSPVNLRTEEGVSFVLTTSEYRVLFYASRYNIKYLFTRNGSPVWSIGVGEGRELVTATVNVLIRKGYLNLVGRDAVNVTESGREAMRAYWSKRSGK